MKKIIILTLVGMMAFTGFTFADEIEETAVVEPVVVERAERPERPEREQGDSKEKLTQIIETYSPELLASFTAFWNEHDAVHLNLTTLKETSIAEKQTLKETFRAEMKVLIEAEEMTREDLKVIVQEMKVENQVNREEIKATIDALKVSYGIDREVMKVLNQELKAAVELEDDGQVLSILGMILNTFENHVSFDQAKYEFLSNK